RRARDDRARPARDGMEQVAGRSSSWTVADAVVREAAKIRPRESASAEKGLRTAGLMTRRHEEKRLTRSSSCLNSDRMRIQNAACDRTKTTTSAIARNRARVGSGRDRDSTAGARRPVRDTP